MPSSRVRTLGLVLALGTVVVAILGTQYPFNYRLTGFAVHRRWDRIDWSWFPRHPGGEIRFDRDFAVNLVMLIPLGIGFGLWRHARAIRTVAESLMLGILTSGMLEIAQLVTAYRYTSFADVWRNALGCMVGCILALASCRAIRTLMGERITALERRSRSE
jgi:hypothetical protein